MDKIIVIGGGSWGTSFANYLATQNKEVKIWIREKEVVDTIKNKNENAMFLPGTKLSKNLIPVSNLEEEVKNSDIVIFAVPSKFIRITFEKLKDIIDNKAIVNLSKGFESTSLKTISQISADVLGKKILDQWVTVSGPSFAKELAGNFPTAVVAASENESLLKRIQESFSSNILRIYRTNDLMGIEVAGSMKNVMAIASGIINGSGYGYNTTASLVTRASVEISRIGLNLGAKRETFWGLAGIGDLMLTCFGPLSRNFQLGVKIAKGESLENIEKKSNMIAEGVETTKAIKLLSDKLDIEMPITQKVYEILYENKNPLLALKELMQRSLKIEWNIN
ncbi:MAG: NAD(P)H-dependent glycerol-3-phosphate dehydrogenase [Acidobacteriota bacterium]